MPARVTRAPALLGALRLSRHAAIGVLVRLVIWFELPERIVKAVGSELFGLG
jgi:hypothetical protein